MKKLTRGRGIRNAERRGAFLVAAMIALLLATMIGAALLKLAIAQRRQTQREELRLQAEWLVESALERAALRLSDDPEFDGEHWQVPAAELDGVHAGDVRVSLEPAEGLPDVRQVSIVARYPAENPERAQVSRSFLVNTTVLNREDTE